jgi:hypothetical protein
MTKSTFDSATALPNTATEHRAVYHQSFVPIKQRQARLDLRPNRFYPKQTELNESRDELEVSKSEKVSGFVAGIE